MFVEMVQRRQNSPEEDVGGSVIQRFALDHVGEREGIERTGSQDVWMINEVEIANFQ